MWRNGALVAAIVIALEACGAHGELVPVQTTTAASPGFNNSAGWLQIEPIAVDFPNGKSRAVAVRVWQHGFTGRFRVHNECSGVIVWLKGYVTRNAAIFKVRPDALGKETCNIRFTGSRDPRGSHNLHVRVLN